MDWSVGQIVSLLLGRIVSLLLGRIVSLLLMGRIVWLLLMGVASVGEGGAGSFGPFCALLLEVSMLLMKNGDQQAVFKPIQMMEA
jgi:hypothetical protein